jgi:hypothetical protein
MVMCGGGGQAERRAARWEFSGCAGGAAEVVAGELDLRVESSAAFSNAALQRVVRVLVVLESLRLASGSVVEPCGGFSKATL